MLFSKHGGIVGQILVHHLIIGEEEEIGLGTFNSLCIIPNYKVKKKKVADEKGSNPGYQEPLVFSLTTTQSNGDITRKPSCKIKLPDGGGRRHYRRITRVI